MVTSIRSVWHAEPRNIVPALAIVLVVCTAFTTNVNAAGLSCSIPAVKLDDAYTGCQLLIADGPSDVTRNVHYTIANPAIARAAGCVTPLADGDTQLVVTRGPDRLEVPVHVSGFAAGHSVDFQRELVPLLS